MVWDLFSYRINWLSWWNQGANQRLVDGSSLGHPDPDRNGGQVFRTGTRLVKTWALVPVCHVQILQYQSNKTGCELWQYQSGWFFLANINLDESLIPGTSLCTRRVPPCYPFGLTRASMTRVVCVGFWSLSSAAVGRFWETCREKNLPKNENFRTHSFKQAD